MVKKIENCKICEKKIAQIRGVEILKNIPLHFKPKQ